MLDIPITQIITLTQIITFVIILIATILAAKVVNRFLRHYLTDVAEKMNLPIDKYNLLRRTIVALIYVVGIMFLIGSIPWLQSIWLTIVASVSIVGIIVAIGAQSTISNVVGGISIVLSKPLTVGDMITFQDKTGILKDINLTYCTLETKSGETIVIPNALIDSGIIIKQKIEW